MKNLPDSINGGESLKNMDSSLVALISFYKYFNHRDAEASAGFWAKSADVAMDNPLGGIRRGWEEIKSGYENIMNGQAKVYVEFFDYTFHKKGTIFFVEGRERGTFEKDGKKISLKIRTSRIFELVCGQWKQVHHHGSIEDPELLASYQAAVNNH